MKSTTSFNSYSALQTLIDNNIITFDYVATTDDKNIVTVKDNSKYEVVFDLTNNVAYTDSIKSTDKYDKTLDTVRNNYVLIRDNNNDSILQLWGQSRNNRVVVEVRQNIFKKLALDDVKFFREHEHEMKASKETRRCYVMHNDNDMLKFAKEFFKRFEKSTTKATQTDNASEKVS